MASFDVNVNTTVNSEAVAVGIDVEASTKKRTVQVGFVIPKHLFRDSLLNTLFTYESDRYGVYVGVLGFFFNYSNLERIAIDEVIFRRLRG